ncbi:MAG: acyl-CoA dehydrogenase family protein [Sulfolobaceae archaeon]|jgi:alkylation response protein AidB-like acyl-CoA dehydrogenase|nr:acyl-CoA dehydrogenase family protein [Sulfolobaceae archaeon]
MSEESELIVQSASEVAKQLDTTSEEQGIFVRKNLELLAQQGFMGILIPKPYGMGLPARVFVDVVKTIAKASPSTAWLYVTHVASTMAFNTFASQQLKDKYMKDLVEGKLLIGAAGTESVGGAINAEFKTNAELKGDKYVINGSKTFITGAGELDLYLIITKITGNPKPGVILVDKSKVKVGQRFTSLGMKGISWGELVLENVEVPKENFIVDDFTKFLGVLGRVGMLGVSAISVGLAEGAFEEALTHVKSRKLGQNTLSLFEGVQIYLAEMSAKVEAMKQLLYYAADQFSSQNPLPAVLKARVFITENALDVIDKAMRITGGHGFSSLLKLEKYYRDARAPMLHFQTLEVSKKVLAGILLS